MYFRSKRAAARLSFKHGFPEKLREQVCKPTQRLNRPRRQLPRRATTRCRRGLIDQFDISSVSDTSSKDISHDECRLKSPLPDRTTIETLVDIKDDLPSAEKSLQARDDSSDATIDLFEEMVLLKEQNAQLHQELREAGQPLSQIGLHASTQTDNRFKRDVQGVHDQLELYNQGVASQHQALRGQIDDLQHQLAMWQAKCELLEKQLRQSKDEVVEQAQLLDMQSAKIDGLQKSKEQSARNITELAVQLATAKGLIRPNTSSLRDVFSKIKLPLDLVDRLVRNPLLFYQLHLADVVENLIQRPEEEEEEVEEEGGGGGGRRRRRRPHLGQRH